MLFIHYIKLQTKVEQLVLTINQKTVVRLILQPLGQIFVYYKSAERNFSRKDFGSSILARILKEFFPLSFF